MYRKILLTLVIFILSTGLVTAQTDENREEDPFKNNPFFYKPLNELLRSPSTDADTIQDNPQDTRALVSQFSNEGLDHKGIIEAGPYNSNILYSLYPNLPMIHFNRVNGVFLGLKKERMQWYGDDWLFNIPQIQTHGLLGYSFGRQEWEYSIGIEKLLGPKRHIMAGFEYHDATATADYWRVGLTETTITSFLGGYDYLDYYKQAGFGTYVLLRTDRFIEGGISYSNDKFTSLPVKSDFALLGSGGRYRFNAPVDYVQSTPVDTLKINTLAFTGTFNPKRLLLTRNFTLSVSGMAEIGDPGIGSSDYSYNRYTGEVVSFLNFEPGGVFKYRLLLGSITGDGPAFKEFQLGGIGSLRALPYKSMPGELTDDGHFANQMVLSNAEVQFGAPSSDSYGWIDFDSFYVSLFLDSGWVNYSEELAAASNPFTDFSSFKISDLRHNGGIGAGSSLVRCELAWNLNSTSMKPVFWLRLNPTF